VPCVTRTNSPRAAEAYGGDTRALRGWRRDMKRTRRPPGNRSSDERRRLDSGRGEGGTMRRANQVGVALLDLGERS
jgi:hypothetical protein